MHISNIPWQVDVAYPCAVAAVAFWRGGRCERAMASLQVFVFATATFRLWPALHSLLGLPADLIYFAAGLMCVLRGRGYWTVWACATTVLSLAADLIYRVVPGIGMWAYASAELVYSYAFSTAILWGAIAHGNGASRPSTVRLGRPLAGLSGA